MYRSPSHSAGEAHFNVSAAFTARENTRPDPIVTDAADGI
jgi:hypothetical protein